MRAVVPLVVVACGASGGTGTKQRTREQIMAEEQAKTRAELARGYGKVTVDERNADPAAVEGVSITAEYDRFTQTTTRTYRFKAEDLGAMTLAFVVVYKIPDTTFAAEAVAWGAVYVHPANSGWQWLGLRTADYLVDGKPLQSSVSWDGHTQDRVMTELVSMVPAKDFRDAFTSVQTLEGRFGKEQVQLTPAATAKLREFAAGVPIAAAPATPPKTGIPECDAYVERLFACGKYPQEGKDQLRDTLEKWKQLGEVGGEGARKAADACRKASRAADASLKQLGC